MKLVELSHPSFQPGFGLASIQNVLEIYPQKKKQGLRSGKNGGHLLPPLVCLIKSKSINLLRKYFSSSSITLVFEAISSIYCHIALGINFFAELSSNQNFYKRHPVWACSFGFLTIHWITSYELCSYHFVCS